jgi:hypothetical protein
MPFRRKPSIPDEVALQKCNIFEWSFETSAKSRVLISWGVFVAESIETFDASLDVPIFEEHRGGGIHHVVSVSKYLSILTEGVQIPGTDGCAIDVV